MNKSLKYFAGPFILTAIAVSLSWNIFAAEPGHSRKVPCCGKVVSTVRTQASQEDVETSGVPKSAGWQFVCPHWMWMDWGNYQSYYATYKYPEWCTPDNFDTTGIVDVTGSCEDTANCIGPAAMAKSKQASKATAKSYDDDPGDGGYSGLKKSHYADEWWDDLSPEDVTVEEIDSFVIAFMWKGTGRFAQVFIGTAQHGEDPKVIVARGLEIKDPTEDVDLRHDYREATPGQDPLKPAPGGRSHALIYEYNVLRIPIILHHKTPGN
jgi:hypothetical protein